jgi:hypothetical protein
MKLSIEKLTAEEILKLESPLDLIHGHTIKEAQMQYNKIWHPDRNKHPLASQVMAHVNVLIDRAGKGDWGELFTFTNSSSGLDFRFRYTKSTNIDIGKMYMGKRRVVFNTAKDDSDLLKSAHKSLLSIVYPSKILEQNFKRFIPREVGLGHSPDGCSVLFMYKGPEQICLADLLESGFKIEPKHLSWIIDGLYNFSLFMHQTQNKIFGGLGLDSIYINPMMRGVHILGGWWYTTHINQTLEALPGWILCHLPNSVIREKIAVPTIDQVAIKVIGCQLLGDTTGTGSMLYKLNKTHQSLIHFLRSPPHSTLIKDYASWKKIERDLSSESIPITFDKLYTI